MITMGTYKLNEQIEATYEQAFQLIKNQEQELYYFKNLNESTVETQGFEVVQNRRYFITKTGKKGTVLYKGTQYECKADDGLFEIEMTWDYAHPTNFAQNKNGLSKTFTIAL